MGSCRSLERLKSFAKVKLGSEACKCQDYTTAASTCVCLLLASLSGGAESPCVSSHDEEEGNVTDVVRERHMAAKQSLC